METDEKILTWRCPDCGYLSALMANQVPTETHQHADCVTWMVPKWLPVHVDGAGRRFVLRSDGVEVKIG